VNEYRVAIEVLAVPGCRIPSRRREFQGDIASSHLLSAQKPQDSRDAIHAPGIARIMGDGDFLLMRLEYYHEISLRSAITLLPV